ncbi:MAG: transcription initiation factor IIB family protein [Crenarchaeota archaeon]|nr:transcription initiation factor IIB family protein [Thermoproteota archaeon]MCR8453889.1 transcription initiation factor IIB family protein [Thermoproteota archaeon]MCR8455293.1 transcription initiation factor IIB family protein [Thermoproteota archaeon]MCR8462562.1 transcription initiation factor IIB family protein [Thermoproteota archaeon]MCR8470710.1 transcription initiation factor IIB family protein [Thermoproteota archaeon]
MDDDTTNKTNKTTSCPVCGLPLITVCLNEVESEVLVCPLCGRVFDEDNISTDSEQRFFNVDDLYRESRLIKSLGDQHPLLADYQPYSGSNITEDYRSRRVLETKFLVKKFSAIFKLHPEVERKTIHLLLDFNQKRNLKAKELNAYVLAAIFVASRLMLHPVPLDYMLKSADVLKKNFSRALKEFTSTLKIKLQPVRPRDYIRYIAEKLKLSFHCVRIAEELAKTVEEKQLLTGRDPLSVAAACTYISTEYTGETRSQKDFAKVVYCTEITLRNKIREIREALGGDEEIRKIVRKIFYNELGKTDSSP